MKKIEITNHNPDWPLWFEQEALSLKYALGNNCINIHHIGSTAVPGLYAKPKIDIIVEVNSLSETHSSLESIDYEYRGEFNIPLRHFFRKKKPHEINLHVYEKDNPDIELNILFRDFLLHSEAARTEYNALKQTLISSKKSHIKENSIFTGYNLGKDTFIRKILGSSGYDGFSFRFCTHHQEWEEYHALAQDLFDAQNILYNSNHANFSDKDYRHFILSKGTKIISIAEIKWAKNSKPLLKYVHTHKPFGNQDSSIKNLIYSWIESQNNLYLP